MNLSFSVSGLRSGWITRRMTVLITILVLLAVPTTARAQDVDLEALDAWIEDLMEDWSTPGLAVGIVHGDSLVFARGYGVRTLGSEDPVDARRPSRFPSRSSRSWP